MYVHNGKDRNQFGVSSKSLSTLFFEAKFLTELELTNWARLADQEAPGIFLCLCSQGMTVGFHPHNWLLMWVLAIQTQVLVHAESLLAISCLSYFRGHSCTCANCLITFIIS